jgi:hypothetical protein
MSDSLSVSGGTTVDAQGNVTYDFAGHVKAFGVDLPAGDNATPPDDRKLRWLRNSDGAVVAIEYGYSAGGVFNELIETVFADPGGGSAAALSAARNAADGGGSAGIAANAGPGAGAMSVTAQALPGLTRVVIDSAGKSDYVQLFDATTGGARTNGRLKWGLVPSFFTAVAANAVVNATPVPAQLGLTTILAAVLRLSPASTTNGVRVLSGRIDIPNVIVLNGPTVQDFDLSYFAIGN